jgi:hypothetical protein
MASQYTPGYAHAHGSAKVGCAGFGAFVPHRRRLFQHAERFDLVTGEDHIYRTAQRNVQLKRLPDASGPVEDAQQNVQSQLPIPSAPVEALVLTAS